MKNIISFKLLCLFTSLLSAQPTIQWQKALGGSNFDEANKIRETSDGGYVVAGTTFSNDYDVQGSHGLADFWIVKLNISGAVQWTKTLGGSDYDRATDIQQTNDGGYIVGGYTQSNDGDVSGNHGDKDAWVVKLNSAGIVEWQKSLGGSEWEDLWSIEKTVDGGYIMAGRSNSNNGDVSGNHNGSLDYWVVKLDSAGIIEWQKSLGGSADDTGFSIKQTTDDGYILIGTARSNDGDVSGNNGNVDIWVVKLTNSGVIEWQNAVGGEHLDAGSDIFETADGYIACGHTGSHNSGDVTGHHGSLDCWVLKFNKIGDLLWQKTLGGSNADYGQNIIQTRDGMYVVVGTTKSKDGDVTGNNGIQVAWVVKLSESGDLIWQKTLGGTEGEYGASIQQTSDLGYIMAGYAWSNDGDVSGVHGDNDFWVVKLAPETISAEESPASQINHLDIYPNPTQQYAYLNLAAYETPLNVMITDLLGHEVSRQSISDNGRLELAFLPKGMYFLSAQSASGIYYAGKVLKE